MDPLAQAVLIWDQHGSAKACDRSEAVKAGVEAYLGRAVFGAEPSLTIRVRISGLTGGTPAVATVSQEDGSGKAWGERSVSSNDCEGLDEPLTLVVALMIDAGGAAAEPTAAEPTIAEASGSPRPPVTERPLVSTSNEPIETVPSLQHPSYEPGHFAVYASAVATMGLLPHAGFGVALDARAKPSRFWGLSLDAALLAPQQEPVDSGRLEINLAHAGVGLCPLQGKDSATWWSACAKVSVGRLHVRSTGLAGARSKTEWFTMPGLSVAGAWLPRGLLFLGAGLEATFPASADRYFYRDALGTPHLGFQMSPLALTARLSVGLMVR